MADSSSQATIRRGINLTKKWLLIGKNYGTIHRHGKRAPPERRIARTFFADVGHDKSPLPKVCGENLPVPVARADPLGADSMYLLAASEVGPRMLWPS